MYVNHSTLFRIFSDGYTMFDQEQNPFTSYADIRSDKQKEAIFENFFNWPHIKQLLNRRQLEPSFLVSFTNQYDIKFFGKKSSPT